MPRRRSSREVLNSAGMEVSYAGDGVFLSIRDGRTVYVQRRMHTASRLFPDAGLYGLARVTRLNTAFSPAASLFLGRDVDFFETAPSHRTDVTADIDFRPSDQLRLTTSYLYSRISRWRDNSMLSSASVPRHKVEYQLSRPLFLRFVGQYDNRKRDALRDPATDQPLLVNSVTASEQVTRDFRVDWLVSSCRARHGGVADTARASRNRKHSFRELERVRDGFFLKLS